MRTKVTIALLLLNAALFYYIFYVRQYNVGGMESTTILGAEASNIQAITIEDPEKPNATIQLDRRGDSWFIAAPVEWPANAFAIRPIITDLQRLHSEGSFPIQNIAKSGQTLADFGLETPARILTFTPAATPGVMLAPVTLKIGAPTQAGNRLYILSPDGQRVHIVMRSLAESLNVKLDTLRADTLFTIPVFEARSLNIEPAGGSRVRFRRDNERWMIEAPIQARADKTNTEITINYLGGLRVSRFLDAPEAAAPARETLGAPAFRVTIEGNNRSETLLIGGRVESSAPQAAAPAPAENAAAASAPAQPDANERASEYYAQLDGRKEVFTIRVQDRLMRALRDAQQDLRERRILDFDRRNVTAVTINAAGQNEIVLQRLETTDNAQAAAWQIVRRSTAGAPQTSPADHEVIDRLLDRLASLRVQQDNTEDRGFINDAPSDAEKESYGFTARPAREITLAFAPSSPGAVPAPSVTLQIGAGTDRRTYARLTNQNYVYLVSPDILNDVPVTPLAYREHLLQELPSSARIGSLKLTDLRTSAALLEATFPLPADAPNRAAIEALAAQLRTLRAKTIVADDFASTVYISGEERPWAYQLETTIIPGGGATGQTTTTDLFMAARTGGTTQYMGTPQFRVIFEAEQPLIDALHALLYAPRDPGPPPPPPAQ